MYHTPVLLNEVLAFLNLQSNQNIIDCTIGGGGHALEMLKKIKPQGRVIGIDADPEAHAYIQKKITNDIDAQQRLILIKDNFRKLQTIVENSDIKPIHAVLLDLGVSSHQIDEETRGFSFKKQTPLQMSFHGGNGGKTAGEIINNYSTQKLKQIFQKFADIKRPDVIAHRIHRDRSKSPITTTSMLVTAVLGSPVKASGERQQLSPKQRRLLAKVWQAIRIEVNQELENLSLVLPCVLEILAPDGRVAVISYHSLEDRIVKHFFRFQAKDCICPHYVPRCMCNHKAKLTILTKKAVRPSESEIARNSRAKSARLRVAQKN